MIWDLLRVEECLGPKQNRSLITSPRCHISVDMTRLWKNLPLDNAEKGPI